MSESRNYQVTGLVLRSRDYGEADSLISLFTREQGKVLAVARGVRKPRAKLAAALQQFVLGEVHLARGHRFPVVTQVRVINPFYALRADMDAFCYASYFAELFDCSLEEHQSHPALFDLLVDVLGRLAGGDDPELQARCLEINLIALLGYMPQLSHCARCQSPLSRQNEEGRPVWPTWLGFSARQGGALCPDCLPAVPGARRVAAGTVQVAQLLLKRGPACLHELRLSPRLRQEIGETFQEYLEYRLERRLQSARFLRAPADEPRPAGQQV